MTVSKLPPDYLERAYAGVLGKLVGVYVGRPFEGWTHQKILEELGPIRNYVHESVNSPLVVTDDDVSGTFVFVRALEEHGADLTAEDIGNTWLNNTVEKKSIFWWGGRGVSTEHTAFLNLKHGIKAPRSGSMSTNGQAIAEQIGAQIFIDGWALVAPGRPDLAATLAQAAASVSHDGVSSQAAILWAAMEAEAFVSDDVDHLLDVGLRYIPNKSPLRELIQLIRAWVKEDGDWLKTRQRIENHHGYDKYPGHCHVMPNHGIMIMALLYGGHNFHEAIYIINTAGWDTDCNSGNIGCLVAIMHGLKAFEGGADWLTPLADRALISSSDGGYSINNGARITYDLVDAGRRLAGEAPLPRPKNGVQFHFTLPGSVQGFQAASDDQHPDLVHVKQAVDNTGRPGLAIYMKGLADHSVEVMTDTFSPSNVRQMKTTYDLMASPLISPGQTVTAVLRSDPTNQLPITAHLTLKHYTVQDSLSTIHGPSSTTLAPGQEQILQWQIPDTFDSQPIQQVGITLTNPSSSINNSNSGTDEHQHHQFNGLVWLDSLSYSGSPHVTLRRPSALMQLPREATRPGMLWSFWLRAWIHNLSNLTVRFPAWSFSLAQDQGEGIMTTGTREWTDYAVTAPRWQVVLGGGGLVARVRGLNRYYALMFNSSNSSSSGRLGGVGARGGQRQKVLSLVKARDEQRLVLAEAKFDWVLDREYCVALSVKCGRISGYVDGVRVLEAQDGEYTGGGIGAVVLDGSVSVDQFDVGDCL